MSALARPLLLFSFFLAASGQVFTSVHRLHQLSDFEAALLDSCRRTDGLPGLRAFAAATEAERRSSGPYAARAVHQYRLLRRFTRDWPAWIHRARLLAGKNRGARSFLTASRLLAQRYGKVELPRNAIDYAGYALAILQKMYGDQAKLQSQLSDAERLEIAVINLLHNFDESSFYAAIWWTAEALKTLQRRFPYWSDAERLQRLLRASPRPQLLPLIEPFLTLLVRELPRLLMTYRDFMERNKQYQDSMKGCRVVHDTPSPEGRSCFYFAGGLGPYAPFQYEVIHPRPLVAVIHRLVPPTIARNIIRDAAPTMGVSRTLAADGTWREELTGRVSENGILVDNALSTWLDMRAAAATRLSMDIDSAEAASIINYGIGGYYKPHFDSLNYTAKPVFSSTIEPPSGHRLATLMVYLSSPSLGGATVFPNLQASVMPEVGKAVFWFNLDNRSGALYKESFHAACPVIDGSKWIVNKWIRPYNNLGRRQPGPRD